MKREKPPIIMRKLVGGTGIFPISSYDFEQFQVYPADTEFDVKARTKRSNPQNRLYWQILSNVIKACGATMPAEVLHDKLKSRLGYTFLYRDLDGSLKEHVDSTAFDNMEQPDFQIYFDAAMKELAEVCGFDPMQALGAEAA